MAKQPFIALFTLVFALSLFALTPLTASYAKAADFTQVVAFGDSFSDDGFADGAGFKRYTETTTWVEQLAAELKAPLLNLAWGGSMSNLRNCNHPEGVNWSGLEWQVDEYLKSLKPGQDISTVLFTVMTGSNDIWGGIDDGAVSAANIKSAIEKLAKAGAKHVLYRETSAVLLSPGYLAGDYVSYAEPWTKLVNDTNKATRESLAKGLPDYPGLKIYYHETDGILEKVKSGADGFKFQNLTEAWWGTYTFPEPGAYLWYDEWHPMGALHKLIAQDSLALLGQGK
jgi:phospholipase/lecithinase/hemolysin